MNGTPKKTLFYIGLALIGVGVLSDFSLNAIIDVLIYYIVGGFLTKKARSAVVVWLVVLIAGLYTLGGASPDNQLWCLTAYVLLCIGALKTESGSGLGKPTGGTSRGGPSAGGHVFGTAGEGISHATTVFGERAIVGATGERRFGDALEAFTREFTHVRVFHTLHFDPAKRGNADVDHAVVIGRDVFLIDSKNWKAGNYKVESVEEDGSVNIVRKNSRNDIYAPFPGGRVKVKIFERLWKDRMGYGCTIHSSIVLTGRGNYNIVKSGSIDIRTIDDAISHLRNYALRGENQRVYPDIVNKVHRALKN